MIRTSTNNFLLRVAGSLAILLALPIAATAAPSDAATITKAINLTDEQAFSLPASELTTMADALRDLQVLGFPAGLQNDKAAYLQAFEKAERWYKKLQQLEPTEMDHVWKKGQINYLIGEIIPTDQTEKRMALYEEVVTSNRKCTELEPQNVGCWLYLGAGIGRLATTKGILSSLFSADDVEEAWLKGLELAKKQPDLSIEITNGIRYGLSQFYRMVPDRFIVKLLIGTRGDIDKTIQYLQDLLKVQPNRVEAQKELAVGYLCRHQREGQQKDLQIAQKILARIVADEFNANDIRSSDAVDKEHALALIEDYSRACEYSRDGYQDLSDEALEKVKK